jgi:deoxyribodipyrimidine photo-lyase
MSSTSDRSNALDCLATNVKALKHGPDCASSGGQAYSEQGKILRIPALKLALTHGPLARLVTEAVFDLRHRLKDRGSNLLVRFGFPEAVMENIVKAVQAKGDEIVGVHIQKEICSEEIQVERQIRKRLEKLGVSSIHLHDLKHMVAKEDLPFSIPDTPDVFTPFRKKVEALGDKMVRPMLEMPDKFLPVPYSDEDPLNDDANYGQNLEKEGLETVLAYFFKPLSGSYEIKYADPKAAKHASSAFPWAGGETSALERLEWYFITGNPPPVAHYKETRNMLVGHAYSTKMSPFLCIGCISPRMIYKALDDHEKKYGSSQNTYWVRFELLWRDYFIYISEKYGSQLFQIEGFEKSTDPKAAEAKKNDWNNWDPDNYLVKAWCRGRTGIPFIDANIIELRETGFMSNRGRQNVASFLTKDLYFDWRIGAEFFESQ